MMRSHPRVVAAAVAGALALIVSPVPPARGDHHDRAPAAKQTGPGHSGTTPRGQHHSGSRPAHTGSGSGSSSKAPTSSGFPGSVGSSTKNSNPGSPSGSKGAPSGTGSTSRGTPTTKHHAKHVHEHPHKAAHKDKDAHHHHHHDRDRAHDHKHKGPPHQAAGGTPPANPPTANPSTSTKSQKQSTSSKFGRIEVFLPHADAVVFVNGSKSTSKGRHRLFKTPTLGSGKQYTARVVATWTHDGQEVRAERRVHVTAGNTAHVHFHHGQPASSGQTVAAPDQSSPK
jgi:uncharacterized protein (TIGR03000 family)